LEEKLAKDFTDFADLFGHKKAQKTRREIRRRLPKLTGFFFATRTRRREEKSAVNPFDFAQDKFIRFGRGFGGVS
jgi:hypothetical protein